MIIDQRQDWMLFTALVPQPENKPYSSVIAMRTCILDLYTLDESLQVHRQEVMKR